MKIVLDTNVIISGIFWTGAPNQILSLWIKGQIRILITKTIFKEYLRILQKIDKKGLIANKWAVLIIQNSTIIPDKNLLKICRDPADNKFLNCALVGKADFVISGDDDLLSLKKAGKINIVSPAQFIKIKNSRNHKN